MIDDDDLEEMRDDISGLALLIHDILNEVIAGDDQTVDNLRHLRDLLRDAICETKSINLTEVPTIREYLGRNK
jgi:enolase